MNTLFYRTLIINRNQHFVIARKFFDTQTLFATFWHKEVRFLRKPQFQISQVQTLRCMTTTSRILQFFVTLF